MRRILLLLILTLLGLSVAKASVAPSSIDREIQCLALNIYFEARGESKKGQFAVAAVTMNRVKSYKYPNSVCEVVWQRRQFSWTHDGKSDRPRERKAWIRAKQLAGLVHSKYLQIYEASNGAWDITQGALHYYSTEISTPYWAKEKMVSALIGRHRFILM